MIDVFVDTHVLRAVCKTRPNKRNEEGGNDVRKVSKKGQTSLVEMMVKKYRLTTGCLKVESKKVF